MFIYEPFKLKSNEQCVSAPTIMMLPTTNSYLSQLELLQSSQTTTYQNVKLLTHPTISNIKIVLVKIYLCP